MSKVSSHSTLPKDLIKFMVTGACASSSGVPCHLLLIFLALLHMGYTFCLSLVRPFEETVWSRETNPATTRAPVCPAIARRKMLCVSRRCRFYTRNLLLLVQSTRAEDKICYSFFSIV